MKGKAGGRGCSRHVGGSAPHQGAAAMVCFKQDAPWQDAAEVEHLARNMQSSGKVRFTRNAEVSGGGPCAGT